MGKVLLWDRSLSKKKKCDIIKDCCFGIISYTIINFVIILIIANLGNIWISIIGVFFVLGFLLFTFVFLVYLFRSIFYPAHVAGLLRAVNDCYSQSIREALVTKYPQGVVYILENVLEHLAEFKIDYLPYVSEQRFGWPNQTNLYETIDIARALCQEWPHLNAVDRSHAMTNIRSRIQSEDIWLDGSSECFCSSPSMDYVFSNDFSEKWMNLADYIFSNDPKKYSVYVGPGITLSKYQFNLKIYKYYYDENDYHAEALSNEKLADPILVIPLSSAEMTANSILTFEDWMIQNPVFGYASHEEQQKAYQKYFSSAKKNV